jgi:hypothetical protein
MCKRGTSHDVIGALKKKRGTEIFSEVTEKKILFLCDSDDEGFHLAVSAPCPDPRNMEQ